MKADQKCRKLREHREELAENPDAYVTDLLRLEKSAVRHLQDCGFKRVTHGRCTELIRRFISTIFETQDCRPFLHIDVPLPHCWNQPKDWGTNYILYQWGHLRSCNQNANARHIENLALMSPRCNQLQTAMDCEELVDVLSAPFTERIQNVLDRRKRLFESAEWKTLVAEFERFR